MASFDAGLGLGEYLDLTTVVLKTVTAYAANRSELPKAVRDLQFTVVGVQFDLELERNLYADECKRLEVVVNPEVKDELGMVKDDRSGFVKAGELLRANLLRADTLMHSLADPKGLKRILPSSATLTDLQNCSSEIMKSAELLRRAIANKKKLLAMGKEQAEAAALDVSVQIMDPAEVKEDQLENKQQSVMDRKLLELEGLSQLLDALRDVEKVAVPVFPDVLKEYLRAKYSHSLNCIALGTAINIDKVKRVVINTVTRLTGDEKEDQRTLQEAKRTNAFIKSDIFDTLVREEKAMRQAELELEGALLTLEDVMRNVSAYEIPINEDIYRTTFVTTFKALNYILVATQDVKKAYTELNNLGDNPEEKLEREKVNKVLDPRSKINKKAVRISHEFLENIVFSRELLRLAFTSHSWALKYSSPAVLMSVQSEEERNVKRAKFNDPYQEFAKKVTQMHDEARSLVNILQRSDGEPAPEPEAS